jgi:hypothetical protein
MTRVTPSVRPAISAARAFAAFEATLPSHVRRIDVNRRVLQQLLAGEVGFDGEPHDVPRQRAIAVTGWRVA